MSDRPSTTFKILRHESDFIAIEKPPGFHVHQPEFPRRRVSRDVICLPLLRDQIDTYLFPVHRIDVATEGVLVFALNKPAAANLCRQFQDGKVKKTYFAVVRGWTDPEGAIDAPLALDSTEALAPSLTRYKTRARIELPYSVRPPHPTSRYSLVEAFPETGRFHQVRRHMARISHPLLGDAAHGDSHHNRFFRETLGLGGLWLAARSIEFQHPSSGENVRVDYQWSPRWLGMFERLGITVP